MSACIRQTATSHPKFAFPPTFIFCSPIPPNNCGVVFFVKIYFSFREMIFFRLIAQICKINFHREYYPSCVTSFNEYTWPPVFLLTESFLLSSKLNPLSLFKLQSNIYFLVNIFARHTFPMSNGSIKTKTVLTMTDMKDKRMVKKLL